MRLLPTLLLPVVASLHFGCDEKPAAPAQAKVRLAPRAPKAPRGAGPAAPAAPAVYADEYSGEVGDYEGPDEEGATGEEEGVATPEAVDGGRAISRAEALELAGELVKRDMAAGFKPLAQIIDDAVEFAGVDYPAARTLRPAVSKLAHEALAEHRRAQATWPKVTDCDRLDAAFAALEKRGVLARQDYSDCGTCGAAEIWDELEAAKEAGKSARGYVFFHQQDTEGVVDDGSLYLSYGSYEDSRAAAVAIGREVVAELRRAGLRTEWNGELERRIGVHVAWKRRRTSDGELTVTAPAP